MYETAKLAAAALVGLVLVLGAAQAGPYTPIDPTPPPDYPPIDVPPPDYTPIDVIPNIPDAPPLVDIDTDEDDANDRDEAQYLLSCRIIGGEVVITNEGVALPQGTKVQWKGAGDRGTVLLPK